MDSDPTITDTWKRPVGRPEKTIRAAEGIGAQIRPWETTPFKTLRPGDLFRHADTVAEKGSLEKTVTVEEAKTRRGLFGRF